MAAAVKRSTWWWCQTGSLVGYSSEAPDGLEISRHDFLGRPGFWRVGITGWAAVVAWAVVDDFGNLVQVRGAV